MLFFFIFPIGTIKIDWLFCNHNHYRNDELWLSFFSHYSLYNHQFKSKFIHFKYSLNRFSSSSLSSSHHFTLIKKKNNENDDDDDDGHDHEHCVDQSSTKMMIWEKLPSWWWWWWLWLQLPWYNFYNYIYFFLCFLVVSRLFSERRKLIISVKKKTIFPLILFSQFLS